MTDLQKTAAQIYEFLSLSEKLKKEMRHSYLSDRRQESVAEHTWQMSLLALLCHSRLTVPVNLEKVLKMIVVHDLVEAESGDVSYLAQLQNPSLKQDKIEKEQAAIEKIRTLLPEPINQEIYDLWYEFEDRQTAEAKFVKALDDIEVQAQHNLAPMDTWEEKELELVFSKVHLNCMHEPVLTELANAVIRGAEVKMTNAGYDVQAIRNRVI